MVDSSLRWKSRLNQLFFHPETPTGKAVELVMLFCILTSVILISIDSVPAFHLAYGSLFNQLELAYTVLFALEYGLRLLASDKPLRYARSFLGIVDLVALLPTLLGLLAIAAPSLAILRALRFLRIFRILKLLRYSTEAQALLASFQANLPRITVFLGFVLVMALLIGSLMYFLEAPENGFTSIPQSIYWTIVTLTTVGYGDIAPQSALGKLLASAIMLLGYGIIVVPSGLITLELRQAQLDARVRASASLLQSCAACQTQNHDGDAKFCKYCGAALSSKP